MRDLTVSERGASLLEYVAVLAILLILLVAVATLMDLSTQSRLQKAASAVERSAPCGAALSGAECN